MKTKVKNFGGVRVGADETGEIEEPAEVDDTEKAMEAELDQ